MDDGFDVFRVHPYEPALDPNIEGLPYTDEILRTRPDGDVQALAHNAVMALSNPAMADVQRQAPYNDFLILSTLGGLRGDGGRAIALGMHTGHWELNKLVEAAAARFTAYHANPFHAAVSDPCDGRTMETPGMRFSLLYRNDAYRTLSDLARSLPTSKGFMGIATCDKGTPAMLMALAEQHDSPTIYVPGGVALPGTPTEAYGKHYYTPQQASLHGIRTQYMHGGVTLEQAQLAGCAACGTPGGGCQFLGTAATAQVIGEALGMALPHAALAPSGQKIWVDMARNSAEALLRLKELGITSKDILTDDAIHNAMVVHAAFGGSTNLLIHIPAIAYAGLLRRPIRSDWERINRETPRLVDVIPNYAAQIGHADQTTVHAFMAGGVPEVMLHLRDLGLLKLGVMTVTGDTLEKNLEKWEKSDRRRVSRENLVETTGINPDDVINPPAQSAAKKLARTLTFPKGNLGPDGSVIKSSGVDRKVLNSNGVYNKVHKARVFTDEHQAINAINRTQTPDGRMLEPIVPGDVIVLIGIGPNIGMPETLSITRALTDMPNGNQVALITDGRFSGVSSGACIGHICPEATAGGPIGKIRDGDLIKIRIDCHKLTGIVDFVGTDPNHLVGSREGAKILAQRSTHEIPPPDDLPDRVRLEALLTGLNGGVAGGYCVPSYTDAAKMLTGRQPSSTNGRTGQRLSHGRPDRAEPQQV